MELIETSDLDRICPTLPKVLLLLWRPADNPNCSEHERAVFVRREALWAAKLDAMVVPSRSFELRCQRAYPELPSLRIEPVPDLPAGPARPIRRLPGPLRLITLCAVIPPKGVLEVVDCFLRALPKASSIAPPTLTLIGDTASEPSYVQCIHDRVAQAPREHQALITLTGALPPEDVMAQLAHADLYLSASHFESFGMATQEALSLGVPALVSDTGDARFLIQPGTNGHLFPVGDTERLSDLLLQFLSGASTWIHPAPVAEVHDAVPTAPTWEEGGQALVTLCAALRAKP